MKYWLMKSEPNAFSLEDLKNAKNGTECWDGIRNYQARNFMRDEMKIGDRVLFYHSVINPSVVGTAKVVKEVYPDYTAWDPESNYFDPKSTPENPRWLMVDIKFEHEFEKPIMLPELREIKGWKTCSCFGKGCVFPSSRFRKMNSTSSSNTQASSLKFDELNLILFQETWFHS